MIVLLLTHILLALFSMIAAGISVFAPTKSKLQATSVLAAGTLVSGTALVLLSGSNLMQSCVTGLVYLVAVSGMIVLGQRKLAAQTND